MNTKGFVGLVLVAMSALGAGYWMGRHGSNPTGPAPAGADSIRAGASPSALPPVKMRRTAAQSGAAETAGSADGKLSLADLEAKILGLREGDRHHWKDWQKIMDSVAPAD